jgi:hypothetical protein
MSLLRAIGGGVSTAAIAGLGAYAGVEYAARQGKSPISGALVGGVLGAFLMGALANMQKSPTYGGALSGPPLPTPPAMRWPVRFP